MHSMLIVAALSGLALVCAQEPNFTPAEEVEENPAGVTYQAILPESAKSSVRGYVAGTSAPDGNGVNFNVNIYGLPDASLGPFMYHIHDQPVPADGNCTGTKAHLDPYARLEIPPCDPNAPETCQVGDLSGKFGNITFSPFQTTFLDLYLSTASGPASFFGNRSVVVHTSNATRLTCANFTLVAGTAGNGTLGNGTVGNGTASPNSTVGGGSSPSPPSATFTGGATAQLISAGAIIAGLAAFAL